MSGFSNGEYLDFAALISQRSPDTSRKTGAIIMNASGKAVVGCNDFPSGVSITEERLQRPLKYVFTEHAERNAIYRAASLGVQLFEATIYVTWFPCAECARAIVQSGITKLVGYEPDWSEERYNFRDSETILKEGGVEITFEKA